MQYNSGSYIAASVKSFIIARQLKVSDYYYSQVVFQPLN